MRTESYKSLVHIVGKLRMAVLAHIFALGVYLFSVPTASGQILNNEDLRKQISAYQLASEHAEPPYMSSVSVGRVWSHLGTLYEDAGIYHESASAFQRAISFLKTSPDSSLDLARAVDDFGTLQLQMGHIHDAERNELAALELREQSGSRADMVRSWYHLSTLYLQTHRPAKARDYAERAVSELLAEQNADPDEKLNALFALSLSLCGAHEYVQAMTELQNASQLVRTLYRPTDFPVGFELFLLGYAHWKIGDNVSAGELMSQGLSIMAPKIGFSHPTFVSLSKQYVHYLRKTHQSAAANEFELKLRENKPIMIHGHADAMNIASLF
jgi:tetratricopeptide (TPR) repeat protein